MIKSNIYTKFLVFLIIILVFFEPGRKESRGEFLPPVVMGKVAKVDDKSIVILTQEGDKSEVTVTSQTLFVKEIGSEKNQLKKGDNLLVIGQSSQGNLIYPTAIKILSQFQPPMSGDRGAAGATGPFLGTITALEPLTVESSSGDKKIIKITEATNLVKETPVKPSEIKEGTKVRVMAPPKPGGGGREALKIIVLSDEEPSFKKEARSESLLPDLPQQTEEPYFIYGIWLGRGLYSNKEIDRAFRVAHNLGIKYFMIEFKWDYVEPKNNRWEWNNENFLDVEYVSKLAQDYNLSIIPYFNLFMPWGERRYLSPGEGTCEGPPSGRGQYQAPDPKEYAEYVFAVVDKLRKSGVDVRYIELDNEDSNLNDGYRSWSCFINVDAKQIKEAENAAYDSVKASYPDVMVSSTTFSFPGLGAGPSGDPEKDKKRKNSFIKAYFEDDPKPKFDFLGIHEVLDGSGNPFTTWDKPADADYEYNFGSYYDTYDIWRKILDKYGYKDKPIFNLESAAALKGQQDVQMLQRVIFARTNAKKNNVTGWVLSMLTGSGKFTEGKEIKELSVGITRLGKSYELREGYYAYYVLMTTLANYPNYERKITGDLNAQNPWVEKFNDGKGNILYVAFIPYGFGLDIPQTVSLNVGPNKEARLTGSDAKSSLMKSDSSGCITLSVDQHPIFIEVRQ